MIYKIRNGIFESASSSTHALVVAKNMGKKESYFGFEKNYCFGREAYRLIYYTDEKIAYIFAILLSLYGNYEVDDNFKGHYTYNQEVIDAFFKRTIKLCEKNNVDKEELNELIKYFKKILLNDEHDIYVDHTEEFKSNCKYNPNCSNFLKRIFEDDDFYERYLFSKDSYITIGGDEYSGYNIKTLGFEYDYESEYVNEGTEDSPRYVIKGEFWDKLKEYEKTHDVFLKGN